MISLENFSKKDIDTAYYIGWVIHLVLVYLYLDRRINIVPGAKGVSVALYAL